jgi:hypothetical protein
MGWWWEDDRHGQSGPHLVSRGDRPDRCPFQPRAQCARRPTCILPRSLRIGMVSRSSVTERAWRVNPSRLVFAQGPRHRHPIFAIVIQARMPTGTRMRKKHGHIGADALEPARESPMSRIPNVNHSISARHDSGRHWAQSSVSQLPYRKH